MKTTKGMSVWVFLNQYQLLDKEFGIELEFIRKRLAHSRTKFTFDAEPNFIYRKNQILAHIVRCIK